MKTPMQEMLEWINDYPTEVPTIHKSAVIAKAKELLKEEKEVMIDFACNCRNLMAGDEFVITHWYDKTFKPKEK